MGLVRTAARRVAERVARVVARDELFEKPGERAPTPHLPPAAPESPAPEALEAPLVSTGAGSVPESGCLPVGRDDLLTACGTDGQPLILHHWATWCEPCEEELPRIQALAVALGADARVLGVSWELFEGGGDPASVAERVASYQRDQGLSWPSLLYSDEPESLFEGLALSFERIPQTQVLGADGRVLRRFDGPLSSEDVDGLVGLLRGGV